MPTKKKTAENKSTRDRTEPTGAEAMSAIDLLEADHRQVEDMFEEYESLEDAGEREQLALKICIALQVHTQIEEEIFYPAARQAIEKAELIDEAIVEHTAAKQLIAEIEDMEPSDELYDAKVKVLGEQVLHHVEEEEGELFPAVEGSKLDLEALGTQMTQRKAALLKELAGDQPG